MKKVILTMLVAGSLLATSCKKAKEGADAVKEGTENVVDGAVDATKDAAGAVVDGAKDGAAAVVDGAKEVVADVAGISIPSFGNETVDAYVKEYAGIATSAIAAKGVVPADAKAKFGELTAKLPEMVKSLGADGQKLTDFVGKLTAKMNDAAKK